MNHLYYLSFVVIVASSSDVAREGVKRRPVTTVTYIPGSIDLVKLALRDIGTDCLLQMIKERGDLLQSGDYETRVENYRGVHSGEIIQLMERIKSAGGLSSLCRYFWNVFDQPRSGDEARAAVHEDLKSMLADISAARKVKRFIKFVNNCSPDGRIPTVHAEEYMEILEQLDRDIVNQLISSQSECLRARLDSDGRTLWQMFTDIDSAASINEALRLWRYPVSERSHLLLESIRRGVRGGRLHQTT